ncbi:hypothetical protein ABIB94_007487 [Bradyrhizobium sp. JR7.2]
MDWSLRLGISNTHIVKQERAMKALLATAAAVGISFVAYVPPCMAEDNSFTRRPNEMGRKISTITSYQIRTAGGTLINCAGTCFAAGQTIEWKCEAHQSANVQCRLDCNSLPAQGDCADRRQ